MALRASFGFAAAAVFALSACGGGGTSSNSIPMTPQLTNQNNPITGAGTQSYAFPNTAPSGVRIYVHLPLRNSTQLDQLIQQQSTKDSPQYHQWLTPAQFRMTVVVPANAPAKITALSQPALPAWCTASSPMRRKQRSSAYSTCI